MILNSQPFPKSVSVRANSWLIHYPRPEDHPCLSCPTCHNSPCIPPYFFPIEFLSAISAIPAVAGQSRKTNPISKTTKTPQHLAHQRVTTISGPNQREKTNPIPPSPWGPWVGDPLRDKPNYPPRYAVKAPWGEIRFSMRKTNPISPPLRRNTLTPWRRYEASPPTPHYFTANKNIDGPLHLL